MSFPLHLCFSLNLNAIPMFDELHLVKRCDMAVENLFLEGGSGLTVELNMSKSSLDARALV